MKEEKVSINDLEANYKIAGEGPAVLILHGWGGSSDSWKKVQEILAKEGFKVVVPDLPGFGKSLTPKEPWRVSDYVNWVNFFTNYLNLNDFYLVAHSFGGQVAVKFTILHPEKVRKIVFCASVAIRPKPGLKTRIIFSVARFGNAIFSPRYLVRMKDAARNFFYILLRHRDYVKANGTMKETIKKVLEEDLLLDLPKIKKDTLIVWGEDDKLVPLKHAHIYKEKIENSKMEVFPKIGHSPHLEIPDKLAQVLIKFFKS
ncbi:MAG: alpha/beta hydrolase [Candidatus Paceibacterota bacterium]